ncbi:MAG: hypothetical protein JW750_08530 [Anaerolineaceae bacterium]|nr:hypothetical protein [Anaerolineaceae bacterium]
MPKVSPMTSRERVLASLAFQPVDIVPLQIHPSPGGLFEHGQKLLDQMRSCPQDFGSMEDWALPQIPAEEFDSDGRYHAFRTDEWGTGWEYRIYGVWGHRVGHPLADLSKLASYQPPTPPKLAGEALRRAQAESAAFRQHYYQCGGGVSLFETMQSLRPFEDVMIEIARDTPQINQLADMLVAHNQRLIDNALAAGVDAITVGDDFGTQQQMLLSPKTWRRFFLPRYQKLFEPVLRAGKQIIFHSCGMIEPILPDLSDLGVNAVWPQLPLYDNQRLASLSRDLGLAVMLHPDRGELMQRGTPRQVREYLERMVETFDCLSGGSWVYVEIDPGFRWENTAALFDFVRALRGRS